MITVLGRSGFIGSRLIRHLQATGHQWTAPRRDEPLIGGHLGHVIYCVGLTGDFDERPYDGVQAHVCELRDLVTSHSFDSFVYLSSTRVYQRHASARARETDDLNLNPLRPGDFYGLSKALGEAMVLAGGGRAHVVRLSNVYGDDLHQHTFLAEILESALSRQGVTLETAMESEKDYVAVGDVVDLITRIAVDGRQRVYNVAGGMNVTHRELLGAIGRLTGCRVTVAPAAPAVRHPEIDIGRVRREFGFAPANLLTDLPELIASCRRQVGEHALD